MDKKNISIYKLRPMFFQKLAKIVLSILDNSLIKKTKQNAFITKNYFLFISR
jgi:hypothetical protein